jgi:hypothetical protein
MTLKGQTEESAKGGGKECWSFYLLAKIQLCFLEKYLSLTPGLQSQRIG